MEHLELTPAEETLVTHLEEGLSLTEASFLAFPESSRPMQLAKAKLKDNDYIRARLMTLMEGSHLTDHDLVQHLKHTFTLAETNPKASTALLNATKFAFEVKELMPTTQTNLPLMHGSQNFTQNQIINQYYEKAKEHIPEEEIDILLSPVTIDIETIPKKELFDGK